MAQLAFRLGAVGRLPPCVLGRIPRGVGDFAIRVVTISTMDLAHGAPMSSVLRKALSNKALQIAMGCSDTSASATTDTLQTHEGAVAAAWQLLHAPDANVGNLTRMLSEDGQPRLAARLCVSARARRAVAHPEVALRDDILRAHLADGAIDLPLSSTEEVPKCHPEVVKT